MSFKSSKVDKAYNHVYGIYRNYPCFPSTFGACVNRCGNAARGCGLCADCHEKALAEYSGKEAARKFHDAVKAQNKVLSELIEAVESGVQ